METSDGRERELPFAGRKLLGVLAAAWLACALPFVTDLACPFGWTILLAFTFLVIDAARALLIPFRLMTAQPGPGVGWWLVTPAAVGVGLWLATSDVGLKLRPAARETQLRTYAGSRPRDPAFRKINGSACLPCTRLRSGRGSSICTHRRAFSTATASLTTDGRQRGAVHADGAPVRAVVPVQADWRLIRAGSVSDGGCRTVVRFRFGSIGLRSPSALAPVS